MQRALAARTPAYSNLSVVSMRQHLGLIAHVEQRSADRTFVEMISLGSISQPTRLKSASTWSKGTARAVHRLGERGQTRTDC
jgi:hypothetical protein